MKKFTYISVLLITASFIACKKDSSPSPGILPFNTGGISGDIYTIAGNGKIGYWGDGGPADSAELHSPVFMALDASGNIYFADLENNCIRKINTSGIISTIAGTGTHGYSGDGGPAISAKLYGPTGIALDGSGNIYIGDVGNNCIRKINANGIISTIAGNGTQGYSGDGGPADSAELNEPAAIALDAVGNVYVADYNNNRIRKINTSGIISTIAGNGTKGYSGDGIPATQAELDEPIGLAIDGSGNIYIVNFEGNSVCMINTSGIISTIAGNRKRGYSGDGGPATQAELDGPTGLAIDGSGNIYIAEEANGCVRKINTTGIISTIVGNGTQGYSGDGGPATSAELNTPVGVVLDAAGSIYISDENGNRIRKVYK